MFIIKKLSLLFSTYHAFYKYIIAVLNSLLILIYNYKKKFQLFSKTITITLIKS